MTNVLIIAGAVVLLLWAWLKGPLAGVRRWSFALFYDRAVRTYEEWMLGRRELLVAPLTGRVLELGPGTGANLPHFGDEVEWVGLEPNASMRKRLRARAGELGRDVEFRGLLAGGIDAANESFDVVLSTLVLCSVPNLATTLAEIHRVLRPGGQFVFLEHVAAPVGARLRRRQRFIRPLWNFLADGCNPDREIEPAIRDAGFAVAEIEQFKVPRPPAPSFISPHISGIATKGAS